ncbi:hypothetical protein DFO73_11243 [Cytobacillus oceanisediminis]|jgi:hypothetical protein|uniref:Uncharacterized protein n=1 Tax=Cytobacillus oceanisediminis TaxID=665099 RepID=A0A2V2ZN65_9BACI|nr:hypothetical protein [Cytobacillus oceanisediminis]PWW25751.1 hypothetical protein DFO73_11243 [Cytobacillus oceanisediminis]
MTYTSTKEETKGMALTIYNGGFALVREDRSVNSNEGIDHIQYMDVAEKMALFWNMQKRKR